MSDLDDLAERLAGFARARDWEKYHNPRNLAAALSVESAELLEVFQWLSDGEAATVMADPERASALRDECADVLGVDLVAEANTRMDRNEERFPPG